MDIYSYSDKWLQEREGYIRYSTFLNYSYAIRRFKKYFGNREISELERTEVSEQFLLMSNEGCSASAIYNVRQVMAAVYSAAVEEQLAVINPFKKIKIPPQAKKKVVEAYTLEEQAALIKAAKNDVLGEIYIFLLHTGLRKGEFINLRWEDYDAGKHTLSITKSKTDTGLRKVALSDTAEQILLSQRQYAHGFIFSTTQKRQISVTSLKKLCKRLSKEVGFNVTCHRARHTFCTRMVIDAKIDPKTVCTLSGHKSVAFLMQRYVTSDYVKQKKALVVLDGIMNDCLVNTEQNNM